MECYCERDQSPLLPFPRSPAFCRHSQHDLHRVPIGENGSQSYAMSKK